MARDQGPENAGVCAACCQQLEGDWRMIGPRAYHADCEPAQIDEPDRERKPSKHAEDAALRVLHGKDQERLI